MLVQSNQSTTKREEESTYDLRNMTETELKKELTDRNITVEGSRGEMQILLFKDLNQHIQDMSDADIQACILGGAYTDDDVGSVMIPANMPLLVLQRLCTSNGISISGIYYIVICVYTYIYMYIYMYIYICICRRKVTFAKSIEKQSRSCRGGK